MKKHIVTYLAAVALVGVTAGLAGAEVLQNASFEMDYEGWVVVDKYKLLQDGKLDPALATKYRIDSSTPTIMGSGVAINNGMQLLDYASVWNNTQYSYALPATFYGTDQAKVAVAVNRLPETVRLYQDVTLPEGAYALSWDMQYNNVSPYGFTSEQYIAVNVLDSNDVPLTSAPLFITGPGAPLNNGGMQTYTVDISQFAGQTVRLNVEVAMENYFMVVGLDNFRVDVNIVAAPPGEEAPAGLSLQEQYSKLPASWFTRERTGWLGELPPGLERNGKLPPGLMKDKNDKKK